MFLRYYLVLLVFLRLCIIGDGLSLIVGVFSLEQVFADGADPCEFQISFNATPMIFHLAATATLQVGWFSESFETGLTTSHLFCVFLQLIDI